MQAVFRLASGAAAALAFASPGVSVAAWVPATVPLSAPESAIAMHVAAGADGTAAAVWSDGTTVRAAVKRPAAADFEAPVVIGSGEDPDVAVSPSGVVLAVWTAAGGIRASERAAGATSFGDLGLVSNAAGAKSAQVRFFADGRPAVKLERSGGIALLLRQTAAGQFQSLGGPLDSISGTITGSDMDVSDASGSIVAVVTGKDGSTAAVRVLRVTPSPGGGSSGSAQDFDALTDSGSLGSSTTHTHSAPRIITGVRTVISYITSTTVSTLGFPTGVTTTLRSRTEAAGAPAVLDTVATISNGGFFGPVLGAPVLAQRSDGTATVAWRKSDNVGVPALSSADLAPAATTFAAKDDVEGYGSQGVPLGAPELAPLEGGALAMVATDGQAVRAAISSSGQPFGAPLDLTAGADQPADARLAGDGAGGLVGAWTQAEVANRRAFARLYDERAPTVSGAVMPSNLDAGQTGLFSAGANDTWSGAQAEWGFGDGQTATGSPAAHAYAAGDLYAVSVRARDAAGNLSEPIERVVRVTGPPPGPAAASAPAPVGGGGAAARDTTRPLITRLTLTRKRFAVAAAKRRARARVQRGTTVRFRLSEASSVTMTVRRTIRGYRRGRSCSVRKPARVKKPRRCTSRRRVGALRTAGRTGANSVKFSGRVSRRRLARGSYRLSLVAVDPAGNRSRTRSVSFTIARAG